MANAIEDAEAALERLEAALDRIARAATGRGPAVRGGPAPASMGPGEPPGPSDIGPEVRQRLDRLIDRLRAALGEQD